MSLASFTAPPDLLKMLAHELRWRLLLVLARGDRRVSELIHLLEQPANLISYHLGLLRTHDLVEARRSDADGRDMYYSLNLTRLQQTFFSAGEQLHPALHVDTSCLKPADVSFPQRPRILFACTHNSARSQMAEGLLREAAGEAIEIFSAGSHPSSVHPMTVQAMAARGIDISHHHSKGFEELPGQSFDYVITVCDRAREICPVFPGHPEDIHWSLPDPSTIGDSDGERFRAFQRTAEEISQRIRFLLSQMSQG